MSGDRGKVSSHVFEQETQAPKLNSSAISDTAFPVKNWSRYRFISYIGEGGMGRVYKAEDIRLGRMVALKFLRSEDPSLVQRFLREARAQASVEHENVCNVFEAGEIQGRQYIAMQFIEGKTLSQISSEMTLDQKAKLMKDVAAGLHAAHRLGLIHRDIKPGNIMVERREDGTFRPYILDFGLVREVQSDAYGLTGTAIVGTPGYMAPEQAWGDLQKLDRRVDIYSLGATMYELLSGTPPFPATSTMEVLRKLLQDEAQTIRKVMTNIPQDLETIVMKCLEKESERRYESARALADDLQHYLNGEPVEAKRASITYRLMKKARKNRTLVSVSAVAVTIVMLLTGYGIHMQMQARQRQLLGQRFGQQVERMNAIMRIGHTIPLHDIRKEKILIRANMQEIRSQMSKLGSAAQGPGNYALGRGYLSLEDPAKASQHLKAAWDSGYQEPEVAYALGLSYGKLYQTELEIVENIRNKEVREARRKEIEKKYRIPAVQYLRSSKSAETAAPEYAEGLIDFYEKRFDQALAKAASAIRKLPWLYEAKILEGNIYMSIGNDLRGSGDTPGAMEAYKKVEAAYQDAAKIGESDFETYAGLCTLWTNVMYTQIYSSGQNMKTGFEKAEASCREALKADPERAGIYTRMSNVYWLWAEHQRQHGENPESALSDAITAAKTAAKLDPSDPLAYKNLATAYQLLGDRLQRRSEDPGPALMQAIQGYSKALELNSEDIQTYNSLGNTHAIGGDFKRNSGSDPRADYEEAIKTFERGIKINPKFAYIYSNLGVTYKDLAQYEISRGLGYKNHLNLAITNYKKAIELKPDDSYAYNNLGNAYKIMADEELQRGGDPKQPTEQAKVVLNKAIQINPEYSTPRSNLAEVYRILAKYELSKGQVKTAYIDEALKQLQEGSRIKKDDSMFLIDIAQTYMLSAELHWGTPGAAASIAAAQEAMQKAGEIETPDHYYNQRLGELFLLQGREQIRKGTSPQKTFQKSRKALETSLKLNSNNPYTYLRFAELCRWEVETDSAANAQKHIDEGLKFVESALSINPSLAEAYAIRGVLLNRFQKKNAEMQSASRESIQKALEMNGNLQREYSSFL
jgi:serine/threonine-protein kinase